MLRTIVVAVLAYLALSLAAESTTKFPGQWSNIPQEVRDWYRTQMIPGTQSSCCSTADSRKAEELRHDGHYWAKFSVCADPDSSDPKCVVDFMPVPDNAVLHNYRPPREVQLPVVWWYIENGQYKIRCYAPEPDA